VPNFVPIDQTLTEIWPFSIFQDDDRPSSWICFPRVWTTHEDYLVVFVIVQNLVGICAVVGDNMLVLIFCALSLKITKNGVLGV